MIFTCRPDYHRAYLEDLLKKADIVYDYILFYTKPRVDLYIDDKGFRFVNWDETKQFISQQLVLENQLKVISQQPTSIFEQYLRKEKFKQFVFFFNF